MEQESYHQIQHEVPEHPAPIKVKPPAKVKPKKKGVNKTGRKATPAMVEASKKNLKPSVAGEVRNPYGRWGKNGKPQNLKAILNEIVFADGEISSKAEKIMNVLTSLAEAGNIKAIEIILERIDGKVADKVQVESTDPLACMVLPTKRLRDAEEST